MSCDFLPLTGFSRLQTFHDINKIFSPFSADFVASVFTLAQMESLGVIMIILPSVRIRYRLIAAKDGISQLK